MKGGAVKEPPLSGQQAGDKHPTENAFLLNMFSWLHNVG